MCSYAGYTDITAQQSFADGAPGGAKFGGSVRNGSLRLVSRTDGFADRLGPCTFAGSVSGKRDPQVAEQMERAMRAVIAETKELK